MKQLEIEQIPIDRLIPNPWNVNRMDEETMHKLTEYIRREGLVEPIVVRPKGDRFEILGGEHRWKICKDRLGYKKMPCVVVDVDDKRAKILSVNLNEMTGQPVPSLLADLLHDLNREISLDDLETLLPYSKDELNDALELLKLPEGLDRILDEEAKKREEDMPAVVTLVLDRKQREVFEQALEKAFKEIGAVKNRKARAVELMAEAYLKSE